MTVRKVPLRKCLGCGEMKSKKELIRVILTPEGTIETDFTGKKNGRGAYICHSEGCLNAAVKSHGLEKALKTSIPGDIFESLRSTLANSSETD